MRSAWMWIALLVLGGRAASAQDAPKTQEAPPPAPNSVLIAATVDGEEIQELQVYRGLLREPLKNWGTARKEVLDYLIDNMVVDQYLRKLKVTVDPREVEERFNQIKEETKKSKQDFQEMLKKLQISEVDLRRELAATLRWDKFVLDQASDKVLADYFQKNPAMFDGSQMKVRHILLQAKDDGEGQTKIAIIKKGIEASVAQKLAELPAGSEKLAVEKERVQALLVAFAGAAEKESSCPSKKQGGDLPWFGRVGDMVEPFSRVAFALQPFQLSDSVKTEFGYHLILAVDKKQGREVKFEEVKPAVAEIYAERLREAILVNYKARAKILLHAAK